MVLAAANISPVVALVAGILILVVPQLLNYVVAIYLIVVGLVGLNDIYHFVTCEVDPVSWTPDYLSLRSLRWQGNTHVMRRSSAGRW
jgi:hypothetical protein